MEREGRISMNKNYSIEVYNTLRELQIPAHVKGYEYIKSALSYIHNNPNSIHAVTTELYPAIAKIHKTKPSRVERAIRHAISLRRADDATQYRVLGRKGHLSNAEFLATLHEVIKVKLAVEGVAV